MNDPTLLLHLEGYEHRLLAALVEGERRRADGAGEYERRAEMDTLRDSLDGARPA